MKDLIRKLVGLIIGLFLLGLGASYLDYLRISNNKLPIFNVSSYNSKTRKQVFTGVFYTASRTVRANPNEEIKESSRLSFKLFSVYDMKIKDDFSFDGDKYKVEIVKSENCTKSVLYYADLDKKVYTYCLDSIKVNSKDLESLLRKDKDLISDIEDNISYMGLYNDRSTMLFKNNDIRMYQCNKDDNNDVYISSIDSSFQDDFCTAKMDDFKYIFEIEEDIEGKDLKNEKEVFYEDDEYKYQFDKVKSDYVYIKNPSVRGWKEDKKKLKDVLNSKLLTISDLEKKGLVFEKISKNKE